MSFYEDRVANTKAQIAEEKAALKRHIALGNQDWAESSKRHIAHLKTILKADQAALRRYNAMMNAPSLAAWEDKQRRRRR